MDGWVHPNTSHREIQTDAKPAEMEKGDAKGKGRNRIEIKMVLA